MRTTKVPSASCPVRPVTFHVVAPDVVDDVPEYWIVLSPLCGRLQ